MINKIILIVSLLILLATLVFNIIPDSFSDSLFLKFILIIDFVSTVSFFIFRKEKFFNLKNQYLRFSYLFIISLLIVHFQAYIDLALGYLHYDNNSLWINSNVINKSAVVASIGLISFFLGYSLSNKINLKRKKINNIDINPKVIKFLNFIFFVLFLSQINSDFIDSSLYGGGGREESFLLGYFRLFYESSFFALVIIAIHNLLNSRKQDSISLLEYIKYFKFNFFILLFYILLILLSGDRGPIIYLALSFIIGYIFVSKKKFSKIKIISFLIIGASFITILGIIRGLDSPSSELLTTKIENRIYPQSFSPITKELATSILTLQLSVDNVPEKIPHTRGIFLVQNTSLLIPGLNSSINKALNIDPNFYTSPKLLSYLYLGSERTWGVGTSCIADAYLDFGVIGILILFLLFGYFARYIELKTFVLQDTSLSTLALYVLFFSFSIYIGRSNLVVPFTKLAYVLIFLYIPILLRRN